MIEATQKTMELNRALPNMNPKARTAVRSQLDELMVIIAAYLDQIAICVTASKRASDAKARRPGKNVGSCGRRILSPMLQVVLC